MLTLSHARCFAIFAIIMIKDSVKNLAPWEGLVAFLGDNLTGDVPEGASHERARIWRAGSLANRAICRVHPDAGLQSQGDDVHELAKRSSFEEMTWLLLHGDCRQPSNSVGSNAISPASGACRVRSSHAAPAILARQSFLKPPQNGESFSIRECVKTEVDAGKIVSGRDADGVSQLCRFRELQAGRLKLDAQPDFVARIPLRTFVVEFPPRNRDNHPVLIVCHSTRGAEES